ncbi:uncharacterized protein LOC120777818 [Bactrocera tryoni]|uniref:uncharacterized protein LOC120777818 n=1 Tax=Bactrocera tryoni TaxID=59916 RepID=UPI001A9933C4|nr:uncharacterized protein LOC120777818 [Bactrocera tryoni]
MHNSTNNYSNCNNSNTAPPNKKGKCYMNKRNDFPLTHSTLPAPMSASITCNYPKCHRPISRASNVSSSCMEQHADLMEHAIDYKQQHQPTAMWLQQHGSSGGDGKKAGSVFSKFHHPHQQQKHQQQHRLSGDAANSVTPAPPPMPVASPLRHCALEVCTKLRGVCQPMPTIGTACVAGDNIEVFHQDCM